MALAKSRVHPPWAVQSQGTPNKIFGTRPDVELPATPVPTSYDRDDLLADPWVQWVLRD